MDAAAAFEAASDLPLFTGAAAATFNAASLLFAEPFEAAAAGLLAVEATAFEPFLMRSRWRAGRHAASATRRMRAVSPLQRARLPSELFLKGRFQTQR